MIALLITNSMRTSPTPAAGRRHQRILQVIRSRASWVLTSKPPQLKREEYSPAKDIRHGLSKGHDFNWCCLFDIACICRQAFTYRVAASKSISGYLHDLNGDAGRIIRTRSLTDPLSTGSPGTASKAAKPGHSRYCRSFPKLVVVPHQHRLQRAHDTYSRSMSAMLLVRDRCAADGAGLGPPARQPGKPSTRTTRQSAALRRTVTAS